MELTQIKSVKDNNLVDWLPKVEIDKILERKVKNILILTRVTFNMNLQ